MAITVEMRAVVKYCEVIREVADELNINYDDLWEHVRDTLYPDAYDNYICYWMPFNEDELKADFDLECEKFIRAIMKATKVDWGRPVIINMEY